MAKQPILHSELTRAILRMMPYDQGRELIRLSCEGVWPEGGDLTTPLKPDPKWIMEQQMDQQTQHPDTPEQAAPAVFHCGPYSIPIDAATDHRCNTISAGWLDYCGKQHPTPSGFRFGNASFANLKAVYPPLVMIVNIALNLSTQDFGVTCGERGFEDQKKAMDTGMSRTMHSLHLKQKDGFSHAVDLVPWTGHYAWDWDRIYDVAAAMHRASYLTGMGGFIRWGGAWDRRLSDFGDTPAEFESGVKAYAARHQGSDLLDGPHFEWVIE